MRFSFSAEQEEFRGTLRRALEARSPTKEVRRLMATDDGLGARRLARLNQELGLTGIHIPEAYGGQGFGFVELGIVLEEMGRSLLCAPYFSSTVLAATAILNAGTRGAEAGAAARHRRRRARSPRWPSPRTNGSMGRRRHRR